LWALFSLLQTLLTASKTDLLRIPCVHFSLLSTPPSSTLFYFNSLRRGKKGILKMSFSNTANNNVIGTSDCCQDTKETRNQSRIKEFRNLPISYFLPANISDLDLRNFTNRLYSHLHYTSKYCKCSETVSRCKRQVSEEPLILGATVQNLGPGVVGARDFCPPSHLTCAETNPI
jgi:hypothetical protein